MTKFRIPGLQVPAAADGETRAFFEALKERLELAGGERGDPEQRAVSVRELREAGIAGVRTQNQYSQLVSARTPSSGDPAGGDDNTQQLDFSLYPALDLAAASGDMNLLAQGVTANERFRIALQSLLSLFGRLDQESVPLFPWSFQAEDYGFEVTGPSPRFRLVEQAEESDSESALPADSAIWDEFVDAGVYEFRLRNDVDDAGSTVYAIGRTGLNADYFNVYADVLGLPVDGAELQIGTGGDLRLFHDGANSTIRNDTGDLLVLSAATEVIRVPQASEVVQFPVSTYHKVTAAGIASITGLSTLVSAASTVSRNNTLIVGENSAVNMNGARIGGTFASPTAVGSGLTLSSFVGYGYDGATVAPGGGFFVQTSSAWSGATHGTTLRFHVVANDSVDAALGNATERARISADATGASFRMVSANGGDGTAAQPAFSWVGDTDSGIFRSAADTLAIATGGAQRFSVDTTEVVSTLPIRGPLGSAAAPTYSFDGAATTEGTGMYRTGGGSLGLSVAGVLTAAFNGNGQNTLLDGTAALPAIAFISDPDTGVYRDSSNVLGFSTGGAQRMLVDSSGRLLITTTSISAPTFLDSRVPALQVLGTSNSTSSIVVGRYNASAAGGALQLVHSRGAVGVNTILINNDTFGSIDFGGADGASIVYGAQIRAQVDGTPALGDMPGRISFLTASAGTTTLVERVRITSAGQLRVSDGTAAVPGFAFINELATGLLRPAANALGVAANGGEVARFDANATAGETRFMLYDVDNGALERVTVGVADSGGVGFKLLRIPN